jgi:hypothetical protein
VQPPPSTEAFQRWLRRKCGYQVYETLSGPDSLRLSVYDSVRRNSRHLRRTDPSLVDYEDGINEHAMEAAVKHFKDAPLISPGDGTRVSRALERKGIKLLGTKNVRHRDDKFVSVCSMLTPRGGTKMAYLCQSIPKICVKLRC